MTVDTTKTERIRDLDIWNMEGNADKVLDYLTKALHQAKSDGYRDLHISYYVTEYYGDYETDYELTGTRDLTQAELDRNTIKRERGKESARKSKIKTAEANRIKDLKAIKKLAKKYPDEMREQMLAIGE